jgi:protein TonB
LVEKGSQPNFTELPSQSYEEDTVVIQRPQTAEPQPRIVIPTGEHQQAQSAQYGGGQQQYQTQVQARAQNQPVQPPQRKANLGLTVLLTILGTMVILGGALGVWWFLSGGSGKGQNNLANQNVSFGNANLLNSNSNVSTTTNFNFNAPANLDANANANIDFNANVNANANFNANLNANLKTPSPTPKPTVKPTPTPTPKKTPEANANTNANSQPANTPPANTPALTPKPTAAPTGPSTIAGGVLNSRAISLPKPAYPAAAKAAGAAGMVNVAVTVNEDGTVVSANAVSGHMLLRQAAAAAARQAKFDPPKANGQPAKLSGVLVYNFIQ